MGVVGIDHVQVAAPPGCEAAARRFYGELLGLEEVAKPEALRARGGAWFRAGAQQLHVGVEAAFRSERLGPELGVATELGWYFVSLEQAGPTGPSQARDDFVTLSVLLSLRVHAGARTTLWVGAGPSVELLASKLQVGTQPQVSESGLVPGVLFAVGVERRFARALPFAEVRWSWHRDPGFSTLTGAISAFSFVLGNRFELL